MKKDALKIACRKKPQQAQCLRRRQRGFTLIEAIMVMTITAVLAAGVAVFLRKPIDGYLDLNRRGGLSDVADTAARRISRDLHLALPNSVRTVPSDDHCLEFLPTIAGGRYRAGIDASGGGNLFNTATPISSLDFFGGLSTNPVAGDLLVVYNLGIVGADAYNRDNLATISSVAGNTINFSVAKLFPLNSPANRFQIVSGAEQAVFYVCSGNIGIDAAGNGTGSLVRLNAYGINSTEPSTCPVPPTNAAILAQNISTCQFSYAAGVTTRGGLVSMRLAITRNNETANLYQDVHINNVP